MPTNIRPDYQRFAVTVEGGELAVGRWGDSGPVVLAAHGLTGNHLHFAHLAAQLPDRYQLIAPDLRGRGHSGEISGPFSMQAHAEDLRAVLRHLQLPQADVLVGHSMGAFVAAIAAAETPALFPQLIFVDGGLPVIDELPAGQTLTTLLQDLVGPSMERLDMQFRDEDAYLAYWQAQPAFAESWSTAMEDLLRYDLRGEPPKLVSRARKAAVLGDVRTQLQGQLIPDALEALSQPVRFLRAPRGAMNGPPLYAESRVAQWQDKIRHFSPRNVDDVNHVSIMLTAHGAQIVAQEICRLDAAVG